MNLRRRTSTSVRTPEPGSTGSETIIRNSVAPKTVTTPSPAMLQIASMAVVLFLLHDLVTKSLGTSNGKLVSILDSVNTCLSYRTQAPHRWTHVQHGPPGRPLMKRGSIYCAGVQLKRAMSDSRKGHAWARMGRQLLLFGWILINNFVCKFGPATAVSLALGETPVVLKGPRHVASFALALLFVQLSPRDLVFESLRSQSMQVALAVGVSLYKLRKANFVVETVPSTAHFMAHSIGLASERLSPLTTPQVHTTAASLPFGAVLMWLVIDGTGLCRKVTNVLTVGTDGSVFDDLSMRACFGEVWALIRSTERVVRPNLLLLLVLLLAHRLAQSLAVAAIDGDPTGATGAAAAFSGSEATRMVKQAVTSTANATMAPWWAPTLSAASAASVESGVRLLVLLHLLCKYDAPAKALAALRQGSFAEVPSTAATSARDGTASSASATSTATTDKTPDDGAPVADAVAEAASVAAAHVYPIADVGCPAGAEPPILATGSSLDGLLGDDEQDDSGQQEDQANSRLSLDDRLNLKLRTAARVVESANRLRGGPSFNCRRAAGCIESLTST